MTIFLLCSMLLSPFVSLAEYYYDLSPEIKELYLLAWKIDFKEAHQKAQNIKAQEPENLLVYHIENYIDFLNVTLVDDVTAIKSFNQQVEDRIKMIKSGRSNSPYYYFSQAELYIQRSLVRSKSHEYIKAGWDLNRANKLLLKCQKKFPNFRYANKSLAVIHSLVGTIGGFQKTVLKLFTSLDGSIEQGIAEIDELYREEKDGFWSFEVIVARALLYGHVLKEWNIGYKIMSELDATYSDTPTGRYLLGSTAYYSKNNDDAISWLTTKGSAERKIGQLDYLAGCALLNKQDPIAMKYLRRFVNQRGVFSFKKAAYQKMAWYELLINERVAGFEKNLSNCLLIKGKGNGADQEAHNAALTGVIPNIHLLRSRLLFDGGYYDMALFELDQLTSSEDASQFGMESRYRKARVYHELEKYDLALELYSQVLNFHNQDDQYFACNSALQMAYIFHRKNELISASKFIETSLSIKPSAHKESLHNKAKLLQELIAETQ